jgi:hypothetical protein
LVIQIVCPLCGTKYYGTDTVSGCCAEIDVQSAVCKTVQSMHCHQFLCSIVAMNEFHLQLGTLGACCKEVGHIITMGEKS